MEISEDQAPTIVRALEHYADYLKATNRDDRMYRELAESLKRKPSGKEQSEPAKRKRAYRSRLAAVLAIWLFQGFGQSWNRRSLNVVSMTARIAVELKSFLTF